MEIEYDKPGTSNDTDGLEHFLRHKEDAVQSNSILSQSNSQNSIATKIETILKTYHLEQNRLNHKTNILQFWKSMASSHREMSTLAITVL